MSNALEKLQARIKGSRLFVPEKAKSPQRLYIPYGRCSRGVKTSVWFEVVNDRLTPLVRVENERHPNYYDNAMAEKYKAEIERQFHEIIHDCELQRKKIPLHERLSDEVVPVHQNSLKHQAEALRFCCSMKVSALFADTGTGKTKIAIDLCVSRFEAGQINKVLVFCPVSTKKNFIKELEKWAKNVSIEWKIVGNESMGSSNRVFLEALDWADNQTQVIVDESHMIKTPTAKRAKRIKQVCEKTSYKLVMTGTPVTENVHNLYMQYAVLSELIIGVRNWLKFEEKYLIMGGRNGDEIIGYKNIDHLMGVIEPYTYQIAKEECLNLPGINFHSHYCILTFEQEKLYEQEKQKLIKLIEKDIVQATDIFRTFTVLQQISCGYYRDVEGKINMLPSNKISLVERYPEKTLFFCKYLFEVDLLIAHLGKDNCAVFTGRNPTERDGELESFVSGTKLYFVATMQSGGTGLNGLQIASSRIVFFSNSFSYFHRKQCIGRIDRQGQNRQMEIYDILTETGIDRRIMANLRRKGNLADEFKEMLKDKTELKKYVETI